jgi:hypothetical protein
MKRSTSLALVVLLLSLSMASSCKHKHASAPIQAAPLSPSLPPAPSPKSGCDSLTQKCEALPETELAIPTTSVSFRPPPSWTYATDPSSVTASAPDTNAVLAFTRAARENPADLDAVLAPLMSRLQIANAKARDLTSHLKHPDSVVPNGGVELRLWEFDGKNGAITPELHGRRGSLLFVITTIHEQVIVGIAFVVKPEGETAASQIMSSVQTLHDTR